MMALISFLRRRSVQRLTDKKAICILSAWFLFSYLPHDLDLLGQSASLPFTVADRGGISQTTSDSSPNIVTGYGQIHADPGSILPAGLAIFGLRESGVLISEAGVPAASPVQAGRIYAETGGAVRTGIAIANPNTSDATISFYFTDTNGATSGSGTTTVPAGGQIAKFLDDVPFNGGPTLTGTFTFSSSVPVAVIALRGLTNERSEFIMTTLPVADLTTSIADTLYFPHFADGGGWTTKLALVNPTDSSINGILQFYSPGTEVNPGAPVTVSVVSGEGSTFAYSIPPRSSQVIQTLGQQSNTQTGSARIIPAEGTNSPVGIGIFSYRNGGVTVTEAGVPALQTGTAFRLYAESSGDILAGVVGSVATGLAVANPSSHPVVASVELSTLDGLSTGLVGTVSIPANGQTALFLNQVQGLGPMASPFQGILRISSSSPMIVLGLRGRYNERGDFLITTTPPVNEASATATGAIYFAHIADGGGYTTQLILFSGNPGFAYGTLTFFSQQGAAMVVLPNPPPALESISPNSALVNSNGTAITVTGGPFLVDSSVELDGQPLSTQFLSSAELSAVIPPDKEVTDGTFNIDVRNPAPGGGTSQSLSFVVGTPANSSDDGAETYRGGGTDDPDSSVAIVGNVATAGSASSSKTSEQGSPESAASTNGRVMLSSVHWMTQYQNIPPHINDDYNNNGYCGPASLSMVAASVLGQDTNQIFATIQSYFPANVNDVGTSRDQLVAAAAKLGLKATAKADMGGIDDIKKQLQRGMPVIVHVTYQGPGINVGGNKYLDHAMRSTATGGHYVVVVGYDDNYLYIDDPGRMYADAGGVNNPRSKTDPTFASDYPYANTVPVTPESFDASWQAGYPNRTRPAVIFQPTLGITFRSAIVSGDGVLLPDAQSSQEYGQSFSVNGGQEPYLWSLLGPVPPGLSVQDQSTGSIEGTLTAAGSYTFQLQVRDSSTPPQTASVNLKLTVSMTAAPNLSITSGSTLPIGQVGIPYTALLSAAGGKLPYSWTMLSALPAGLTFTARGGILGTPQNAESDNLQIQVSDSSSPPLTQTIPVTLTILAANRPPIISSVAAATASVPVSTSTSVNCAAFDPDGNPITYSWSAAAGTFPSGAVGSSVSWKAPASPGLVTITCKVSDTKGNSVSNSTTVGVGRQLTVAIAPPSGPLGTSFIITGSGATPNGQVITAIMAPDGTVQVSKPTTAADAQGNFQFSAIIPSVIGPYSETITDTTSGATATVSDIVTGNPTFYLSNTATTGRTITAGQDVSFIVNVSGTSGFNSPVQMSVSGLPAGATGAWSPQPVTLSSSSQGNSLLTINTDPSTPVGTYSLILQGISGSIVRNLTVTLRIDSPTNLSIASVSPNPVTGSSSPQAFTISGSGFTSTSTVTLSNSFNTYPNMAISSRSSTQLVINPTFGTTAANWSVQVIDGAQSSNQYAFQVLAPSVAAPTVSSVSPNPVTGSSSAQTLTINGSNFVNKPTVLVAWSTGSTILPSAAVTFVSSTQLQISIVTQLTPDNWTVTVTNPDGRVSNTGNFQVVAPSASPQITSISPNPVTGASSAQTLTINGSNFVNKPTVFVAWSTGSTTLPSAAVTFISSTQLQISIVTQLTPDNWTVTVTNPDGRVSNTGNFQVVAPSVSPQITSVSPNPVTGSNSGQTLTISGTNFVNKPTVFVAWSTGSTTLPSAAVTFISSTQLQISIVTQLTPDNWTVTVTNPDGRVSNTGNFQVVAPTAAPQITSISPNPVTGSNSAQTLTISGANFVNKPTVFVAWSTGSTTLPSAAVTFISSTQLQISIVTQLTPDNWTVNVTNPDGRVSNTGNFQVVAPSASPQITSISPNPVTGSNSAQTLTINGSNFVNKPTVFVAWSTGSTTLPSAAVTFISSTQLQISIVTQLTPDNWTVTLTNPDGRVSNTGNFQVVAPAAPAPQILSVSPNPVTGSNSAQTLTINGANFVNKPTVFVAWSTGSTTLPSAAVTFVSSTQLQISIVTQLTADNWTVTATNPDGRVSNTGSFRVVAPAAPAPQVFSVSPNPVTGSNSAQTLTINGANFVNKPTVFVAWSTGSTTLPSAAVTFISSTQLQISIVTQLTPDNWTVTVTNPDGRVSNTGNFQVVAPAAPAPQILSVSPNPVTGSNSAQTLTISGSNFVNKPTVFVAWSTGSTTLPSAAVTFVSSTQLQISIVTQLTPDNWSVTVTNPDGRVSNTGGFRVVAPAAPAPQIFSVSPNPVTGSNSAQTLTINGANFVNKPTVFVAWSTGSTTLPSAAVTFISSTQLQISIVTQLTPDNWTVSVTNPDGHVSNAGSFRVVAPAPTISGISPSQPTHSGSNQNVTVFGSNFQAGLTVSITFPNGGGATLSGSQIQSVTSSSFQMIVTLNATGSWSIRVNDPGGQSSSAFSFTVR